VAGLYLRYKVRSDCGRIGLFGLMGKNGLFIIVSIVDFSIVLLKTAIMRCIQLVMRTGDGYGWGGFAKGVGSGQIRGLTQKLDANAARGIPVI